MKKLFLIIISVFAFAYPSCSMCHNGRIAPKIDNMSKKELLQKLLEMKKGKVNPKMAFIKNYSIQDIKKIINSIKEKK